MIFSLHSFKEFIKEQGNPYHNKDGKFFNPSISHALPNKTSEVSTEHDQEEDTESVGSRSLHALLFMAFGLIFGALALVLETIIGIDVFALLWCTSFLWLLLQELQVMMNLIQLHYGKLWRINHLTKTLINLKCCFRC